MAPKCTHRPFLMLAPALFAVITVIAAMAGEASADHWLVRLKQEGFDEKTLALIIQEKAIETAAFSVEELIQLKRAGIRSSTLQILIQNRSFIRNRAPIVYGADVKPIRLASVEDIIRLKKNGVDDDTLEAIVNAASSGRDDQQMRDERLLEGMELRIDTRR